MICGPWRSTRSSPSSLRFPGGGRSIDELTVRSGKRKAAFQNQMGSHWFDPDSSKCGIPFREIIALEIASTVHMSLQPTKDVGRVRRATKLERAR